MKKIVFQLSILVNLHLFVVAQPQFELSRNLYRIPYASGTEIKITNDHFTHDPVGRYDMIGINGGVSCTTNGYKIVAAAGGVIRRLVDSHDEHGPDCTTNCEDYNNYVWIEHANGEWSKYTHIMQYSASRLAGLQIGDTVCAGTFLGYECEIGQASGPHLHFEVRHPNNPNNIDISNKGGFMNNAEHRIPVINSISIHYFSENDIWTASGSASCPGSVDVQGLLAINRSVQIYMASSTLSTVNHSITYENGSNGLFQAGENITITPGFSALAGSYFEARIRGCGTTPFPGGCN
jgi:murein DD-endopeptidase MepM/ murein hydrolase activator NlpD